MQRIKTKAKTMFKVLNNMGPKCLKHSFTFRNETLTHNLREASMTLCLPQPRTNNMKKSFTFDGASIWNSLPIEIREASSLSNFKRKIAMYAEKAHRFCK